MTHTEKREWIVLDMEWNQPLSADLIRTKPVYLVGEVIEIGAVRLSMTPEGYRISGEPFKTVISPKHYKKMHARVAKITGITAEMLEYAPSFPEAYAAFRAWCGEGNFSFFTWGPDDLPMLKSNLELHGMDTEHLPDCYNLQILFNRQITGESRQWALTDAAEHLGIEQIWTAHDALHDAMYTALIAEKLDLEKGIAEYSGFDGTLDKKSLRGIRSVKALFENREIKTVLCPSCKKGGVLSPDAWVSQNPGKKIASYRCSCGKTYFLRCRFSRTAAGVFTANRALYRMTDEQESLLAKVMQKQKRRAFQNSEMKRENVFAKDTQDPNEKNE